MAFDKNHDHRQYIFSAGQLEMQMNSNHTTFSMPILSSELQHLDQYGDSMPENSHRMQVFHPNLGNSLVFHNFTSVEDNLAYGGSLDPLVIDDNLTAGNNSDHHQFGSSSWPGYGLYFNSNLEPASPNFFIHTPSTGKPKARWCKIRAVTKWLLKRDS